MTDADHDAVRVDRLNRDEWQLLKSLRLAALTDSPDAFSPTAAATRLRSEADWRASARRFADSPEAAMFIARDSAGGVGLGSASVGANGGGHIGAMWVHPRARGRGTGARILDAAVAFLWAARCSSISLTVTEGNGGAIALYESRGFRATGSSEALRDDSPLRQLEMRLKRSQPRT